MSQACEFRSFEIWVKVSSETISYCNLARHSTRLKSDHHIESTFSNLTGAKVAALGQTSLPEEPQPT